MTNEWCLETLNSNNSSAICQHNVIIFDTKAGHEWNGVGMALVSMALPWSTNSVKLNFAFFLCCLFIFSRFFSAVIKFLQSEFPVSVIVEVWVVSTIYFWMTYSLLNKEYNTYFRKTEMTHIFCKQKFGSTPNRSKMLWSCKKMSVWFLCLYSRPIGASGHSGYGVVSIASEMPWWLNHVAHEKSSKSP